MTDVLTNYGGVPMRFQLLVLWYNLKRRIFGSEEDPSTRCVLVLLSLGFALALIVVCGLLLALS